LQIIGNVGTAINTDCTDSTALVFVQGSPI
jgi:hypothetical protein